MEFREGLTFDDVLLAPRYSDVTSRSQADLSTRLSRGITMRIPLVSANMDTVTESAMAVAMAREGGIGIIHRFLTVREQVGEVLRVKRSGGVVIESPYTVGPDEEAGRAAAHAAEKGVSGLLVVDPGTGRLAGILTGRDLEFEDDPTRPVRELMTKDVVTAPPGTSVADAKAVLHRHRVEKLPIVDGDGRVRGLVTTKDIANAERFPHASKDSKGRPLVGAAVGVKGDFMDRAEALLAAGADILVVDIAHGHSENAIGAVRGIKRAFPDCELMAGNVATAAGAEDLSRAGVDSVKVGVGSGSICITRVVTGSGVPQLTAVLECARAAADHGVPVVSDGGTRSSGDATKALAAGASSVMIGSMLGGTDESPGSVLARNGKMFKVYRGMASLGASLGRKAKGDAAGADGDDLNDYVAEGVEAVVPYKGPVRDILVQMTGGIRSGLSYCGARTIPQMQQGAEFVRISGAGFAESKPHDVSVT